MRNLGIVFALFAVMFFSGCGGLNFSATPYFGVSGDIDDPYEHGLRWTGGVSLTVYSGRYPGAPAVVQPSASYRNETKIENNVTSSSSSSSSSNSSATQSQEQSQTQSQNQDQSQSSPPPASGGGGHGDGDCEDGGHGNGHGHDNHDDDHPGHGHGHDGDDDD